MSSPVGETPAVADCQATSQLQPQLRSLHASHTACIPSSGMRSTDKVLPPCTQQAPDGVTVDHAEGSHFDRHMNALCVRYQAFLSRKENLENNTNTLILANTSKAPADRKTLSTKSNWCTVTAETEGGGKG